MKSNKGSALLVAILLSAILLAALAGLLTVALNEYRGSLKSYFNTAAFSLAESGVDRAAAAIADKFSLAKTLTTGESWPTAESVSTPAWYKKTSSGKTLYRGYFTEENLQKGRKGVCSVLCIENSTTSYEVYAHGTVRGGEAGQGIEAQRAINVKFTATIGSGTPAVGCVSLGDFISSSTGSSSISQSQIGPTFDSYISTNNQAPDSTTNRYRNTTVGTTSTKDNALNMGNGDFYCNVAIGKGAAEGTKIGYGKDADFKSLTPILTKIADSDPKKTETKYPANEKAVQDYVTRDLAATITQPIPDAVSSDWTQVTPANTANWSSGKVCELDTAKINALKRSGSNVTIGASDTSKTYIATTSLDNVSSINVNGEAILVLTGKMEDININFLTPNAKLKVYISNDLGVVTTTQNPGVLVTSFDKANANYEASRLRIEMMPKDENTGISLTGGYDWRTGKTVPAMDAAAINAAVTNAIKAGKTGSGTVTMNFKNTKMFTGVLNAPYSSVNLSATGENRGTNMSDFCGSLMAGSISITGSNGFAFHFDQQLADGGTTKTKLSVSTWKQILPSAFAAQL